jgi:hypothetical protein
MNASGHSEDARQTLRIIHGAVSGGLVAFGAIVLFLLGSGRSGSVEGLALRWVWLALSVVALFLAGVARGRLPRNASPGQLRTTAIVIWALAEVPALTGLAFALVTGDLVPAVGGLVIGLALLVSHRPATLWPTDRRSRPEPREVE